LFYFNTLGEIIYRKSNQLDLFQYFIAPVLTGMVVLIGQFFVLPKLEAEKVRAVSLFEKKQDTFLKAIKLVDKQILSHPSISHINQEHNIEEISTRKEEKEKFSKIKIYKKKDDIYKLFMNFFNGTLPNNFYSQRGELIIQIKKELGLPIGSLKSDEMGFYFAKVTDEAWESNVFHQLQSK